MQLKSSSTPTRFEATWDSLKTYTVPNWYIDGKFGIFIHWGVYSVPAFSNEWYPLGVEEFWQKIAAVTTI